MYDPFVSSANAPTIASQRLVFSSQSTPLRRIGAAFVVALLMSLPVVMLFSPLPASAGEAKPGEEKKGNGDAAKDAIKKADEIAEAGRLVPGPAGQPECVWVGRRIVGLMWRDDLDTAMRHRELYEKFGCPFPHIQDAFRCVVRNGELDPKAMEALNLRIHTCWINPMFVPPPPTVASDAAAPPAPPPQ